MKARYPKIIACLLGIYGIYYVLMPHISTGTSFKVLIYIYAFFTMSAYDLLVIYISKFKVDNYYRLPDERLFHKA
jgi:hypothetical protein